MRVDDKEMKLDASGELDISELDPIEPEPEPERGYEKVGRQTELPL